jgi:2-methylcitrate dehydratase PrpD
MIQTPGTQTSRLPTTILEEPFMNDAGPDATAGTHSHQLMEHLTQLTLASVGSKVVSQARIRLLDGLGCGIYGSQMPWGKIVAEVAYLEKSQGNATIFGQRLPVAPARAALCNGTAMHGIELDDIAEGAHVHPGAVVIPAALAAAEHCGASGERLLLALVAGYEAMARTGRAIGEAAWAFHITGIAGPVGAAVAAGVAMNLALDKILRAVGIACSNAAGIKSFTQGSGGMVKRMHAGRASESGVLACLLAERGFTAPLAAIDGRFGLLEAFGADKADPKHLTDKLGQKYEISDMWTKVYPCCGVLHTTAQALKALSDQHQIAPNAIRKVRVGTNSRAVALSSAVAPKDTMAAQYSIPFVAGVALTGDPKNPRRFEGKALDDAMVCRIAERVEVYADPEVDAVYPRYATRVEVHLDNGKRLDARLMDAHGMPADPVSEAEAKEKFRLLAESARDANAIDAIIEIAGRVEKLQSLEPLSAALRG